MYEHILARGPLDESVTFGSVKPLDCPFLSHNLTPFTWFTLNDPCFANVPSSTLRSRGLEDVSTLPGNKGCGSARSFCAKEKGPRIRSDGLMRLRQSVSLEPVQCVSSTADRNINPNPRFGSTESSPSPNQRRADDNCRNLGFWQVFSSQQIPVPKADWPAPLSRYPLSRRALCYD